MSKAPNLLSALPFYDTVMSDHFHQPLLRHRALVPAGEEATVMSFKVIDFGHARLIGDKPGAKLPGSPAMEKWYRRCYLAWPLGLRYCYFM